MLIVEYRWQKRKLDLMRSEKQQQQQKTPSMPPISKIAAFE